MKFFVQVRTALCIAMFCCMVDQAYAQTDTSNTSSIGLFPKSAPSKLEKITVSGYYRFFGTYSQHDLPYVINPIISDTILPRNVFIGDDSQLPNLLLNIAGRPSAKTSWGFDVYMFQFLQGNTDEAYSNQVVDSLRPSIFAPRDDQRLAGNLIVHLGINLSGTYNTDYGTFKLRAGGINWHALTDLTMASFKGYNRYVLYEDNPWDPVGQNPMSRYEKYYITGAVDQDTRWGNRAFTGLILDGTQLPYGLQFSGLLGKAEINGGFSQTPNYSYGGKIQKTFHNIHSISLNTMNSLTWADSLAQERVGFHMVTAEGIASIANFIAKAEFGMGQYISPAHNGNWGEAIQINITSPLFWKNTRVSLQGYRISPDVINNTSAFINTSVNEYVVTDLPAGTIGSSAVLQPFASAMVRLGQMTNNRQGLALNTDMQFGKLKCSFALGASGEITAISNEITYGHPVNQFTRTRFWRFAYPTGVGPYERYSVIYRDTYETVHLSDDSSGIAVNKKYFNNAEVQLKYHTKILNRDLYIFGLGQYASVQRDPAAFIVTNEDAYIRQYVHEVELYYAIFSKLTISGYYGYERTLGNYLTDIDEETRRPRNQYGKGLGCGIDVDMGKNARLYVRNRWFEFEDTSFQQDHFKGYETLIEYKLFF